MQEALERVQCSTGIRADHGFDLVNFRCAKSMRQGQYEWRCAVLGLRQLALNPIIRSRGTGEVGAQVRPMGNAERAGHDGLYHCYIEPKGWGR
jgi:hypothetical protein